MLGLILTDILDIFPQSCLQRTDHLVCRHSRRIYVIPRQYIAFRPRPVVISPVHISHFVSFAYSASSTPRPPYFPFTRHQSAEPETLLQVRRRASLLHLIVL